MYVTLRPRGMTRDYHDVVKYPGRFNWVTYSETEGVIHKALIYADAAGTNLEPVDEFLVVKNMSRTLTVTLTFNTAFNAIVNPGTDMDVTILPGQMKAYPDLDPNFTPIITAPAAAECEVILVGFPEWPDFEPDWFCDMWAVGYDENAGLPLTVHFDGTAWAFVANTLPDTSILNDVAGISVAGAVAYWAVGEQGQDAGLFADYSTGSPNWIERVVANDQTQYGDWGFAVNDWWSVGGAAVGMEIWFYNGAVWTETVIPDTDEQELYAVHGVQTADVWAVGSSSMVFHWNGVAWTLDAQPDPAKRLYGVWAWNADDVWICGGTATWGGSGGVGAIWRRVAGVWTLQTIPVSETLRAIWGFSDQDIWCVGDSNMILHWDGLAWTQIASPLASTFNYRAVYGCWPWEVMAGGWEDQAVARIAGWDGVTWTARYASPTADDKIYGLKGTVVNP